VIDAVRGGSNVLAALVHLGGVGKYFHWGVVQISAANLIIIGVMILLFLAAIVLPFPGHKTRQK
jgi:hypothetical protein